MTERRYDDEEVAAIFLAAAEGPKTPSLSARGNEGLTLAELQEIGREAGIDAQAIDLAARAMDVRNRAVSRTLLGLPIGVERTVDLNRKVSDAEWEQLVVELRDVFQARGTVRADGSLRQWTNGNLHVLLEPTPTGHRLRLGSTNGAAQASIGAGTLTLGIAAAMTIALGFSGHLVSALPGIAFISVAGLGLFANGALRLPRWARLRASQMEGIAERAALAGPRPGVLPPASNDD